MSDGEGNASAAAAGVAAIVEHAVTAENEAAKAAVENAERRAETALEIAVAESEAAGRIAQQVAGAALEGERGRQIETVQRELYECREETRAANQAAQSCLSQLAELAGKVETLLALATPKPSTPPISAPELEPLTTLPEILPEAESAVDASPDQNPPAPVRSGPRRVRL